MFKVLVRRFVSVLTVAAAAAASVAVVSSGPAAAQPGGFGDVPEDAYYSVPVSTLAAQGVLAGTGCDEGFCPGEPLDRKTMAVWIVRVLDGQDPPAATQTSFNDVDAAGFHAPFIERMAELGVTTGCGDGSGYCPDATVTRAQMAVFLSRAYKLPEGPDPGFLDVPADAWYATEVAKLAASGITTGCGDGTGFCPSQDTTRAQMATFLVRAISSAGQSEEPPVDINESPDVSIASDDVVTQMPVVGDWVIPVFVCAPVGMYTEQDLEDLTATLNQKLDGFFERLSSKKMTLRFTEGAVLSGDIDWENTDPYELVAVGAFPCGEEAESQSATSQILILLDVPGRDILGEEFVAGYAVRGTGPAVAPPPTKYLTETGYLRDVVHELAHSVLGLLHLKNEFYGNVFVNEGHGRGAEFLLGPVLACHHYEQLDWPVHDYAQPCVRLSPSQPERVSYGRDVDGRDIVTWEPPPFSDDAPVTGYTVRYYRGTIAKSTDDPFAEYGEPADARFHLIDPSIEPGDYIVSVVAHSRYGEGDPQADFLTYVPAPPRLGPIRTINITRDTIQLVWNPGAQEDFREETNIRVTYQIQYKARGAASYDDIRGHFEGSVWLGGLDQGTEYTIKVRACSDRTHIKCTSWNTITASTFTESVLPPPSPISTSSGSDWYLLTWDPVPGAKGYLVELPGGGQVRTYAPDYSAPYGVQSHTTYSLRIGTCSPATLTCEPEDWTAVTVSTTAVPAVPPPYRIGLREIGDSWATILWETLRGTSWLYRVEYEYTDGTSSSGVLNHQTLRQEPLRLASKPNSTYTLKMRNCEFRGNSTSCSIWASSVFSTSPATSPVSPPSVRATDIADIWLGFSWERVPGAVSYDWRFKKATATAWTWGNETEPAVKTSWRLEPNETYTAEVRSCGDPTRPCSDWTTTTVSTARSLPTAPPSYPVSVKAVTDTEIQLAWNPPSRRGYYYTAKLFPTEEEHLVFVHTLHAISQDWVVTGLKPNTAYTLAVRICQWPLEDTCEEWVTISVTTRSS